MKWPDEMGSGCMIYHPCIKFHDDLLRHLSDTTVISTRKLRGCNIGSLAD
jgi:hypothetical protein